MIRGDVVDAGVVLAVLVVGLDEREKEWEWGGGGGG